MDFKFFQVSGAHFRLEYRLNSDIIPVSITLDAFADRVMKIHLLGSQPYEVTKRFFLDILRDIIQESSVSFDMNNIDFTKNQSQVCIGNKVIELNFDAQTFTLTVRGTDDDKAKVFWEIITTLKELDSI